MVLLLTSFFISLLSLGGSKSEKTIKLLGSENKLTINYFTYHAR